MEVTAESFLADCVRRRLLSGVPISPPERERFGAVLAFVDISGFSKLSEHLQVPPPMRWARHACDAMDSSRARGDGRSGMATRAPSSFRRISTAISSRSSASSVRCAQTTAD